MSEFAEQLGARDADMVVAAAEKFAAKYLEPLRTEIEIAFMQGALFQHDINSQSYREVVDDVARRFK